MAERFGSFRVVLNEPLAKMFNLEVGTKLKPCDYVRCFWAYAKANNLTTK